MEPQNSCHLEQTAMLQGHVEILMAVDQWQS